jgi:pyrimidine-nucleoside phosphorylase
MLILGERTQDFAEAKALVTQVRENGAALAKMRACVERQHGNPAAVDDFSLLPQAKAKTEICAEEAGILAAINCEGIGRAAMVLGAGRQQVSDRVDPAVGLTMHMRLGDRVEKGQPMATLHYNDEAKIAGSEQLFRRACEFSQDAVEAPPLIYDVLR